jgi:hypothetical protein
MVEPDAFLRTCLRVHAGSASLDRLRTEAAALNGGWQAAAARIEAERLGPLLHRLIGGRGIAPPEHEQRFRLAYRQSALRTRLLLGELATCVRACTEAGIALIVLKGAALAERVYGDPALRPMLDLDLLARPSDRGALRQVLELLGYASATSRGDDGQCNELFSKTEGVTTHVDLHWTLFALPTEPCGRIDLDWLWTTAVPIRIAGASTLRLGPEAQVLHLAAHVSMGNGNGPKLLWRRDLAGLLSDHPDLDWDGLLLRAGRYDLGGALADVLAELAEDWHAPVPARVLVRLRRLIERSPAMTAAPPASTAPSATDGLAVTTSPADLPGPPALARPIQPVPRAVKRDLAGADALVTCMYNGLSGTTFGGRLNRDRDYRESLMTIASNSGLRVFCFVPAADIAAHQAHFAPCPTEIAFEPLELTEVPWHARIQQLKSRHRERYADLAWRERCVEIMWGKFVMLERVIAAAPDASHVYWIDAGLANVNIISTKYIAEADLDSHRLAAVDAAFAPLFFSRMRAFIDDRLLLVTTTQPHNRGIPERYNARPYADATGAIGGLFGGSRRRVAELCARFRAKVDAILAAEELYFEESILTGILADAPELFRVFTFDSWYHEGWPAFVPGQVNFSNFFDRMLETPVPERIVRLPWFR